MKKRPRTIWFVVGVLMMVVGVIVIGVRGVLVQDGVVAADGQPHVVRSPTGEERMVFRTEGAPAPTRASPTEAAGRCSCAPT